MSIRKITMRNIARSLYLLILLGFSADVRAQLPPEIMSDRYLVKAELLEASKDYAAAFNVMEKVIALHKTHDLRLPVDFHFKYARVALEADSIRIAYDSVNLYLTTAGREGEFYREALLLSLEAEEELEVPEILPEDMCEGKEEGACWMELANHPQCYVWDDDNHSNFYVSKVTVSWSGACFGAAARGEGTLVWNIGGNEDTWSGRLRQGKPHGHWVLRNRFKYESEGSFANGKRHGHWILHIASNYQERGDYIDDKRDGKWLRMVDDSCFSITYRQAKRALHDTWIGRDARGGDQV